MLKLDRQCFVHAFMCCCAIFCLLFDCFCLIVCLFQCVVFCVVVGIAVNVDEAGRAGGEGTGKR